MTRRSNPNKKTFRAMACVGLSLGLSLSCLASAASKPDGQAVIKSSDCASCHALDRKLVGPAFQQIAGKYAAQPPQIVATLTKKVKDGGAGNWGEVPMPPHPQLSDADLAAAVRWILSQKPAAAGVKVATASGAGGPDAPQTYKNADGKQVTTDFQVYTDAKGPKVSEPVFKGYETYNSYCFRCHGGDAVGGDLAPDLRQSLDKGMTWEAFLSVAMVGRQDKGMPSWAGFFEEKDLREIYDYVKARQLNLVPAGRPASAQD
jgi:cytochrome c